MRKSPTLAGLRTAAPVHVWSETAADSGFNFWAPEFHRLTGPNGARWYLMYTPGTSANLDGQKLRVLESAGDDPMGPYAFKATPMPSTWNIDGSYLAWAAELYLLWSEWQGPDQSMWISRMTNPWTVTGSRVLISRPTNGWETQGGRTNEAPGGDPAERQDAHRVLGELLQHPGLQARPADADRQRPDVGVGVDQAVARRCSSGATASTARAQRVLHVP